MPRARGPVNARLGVALADVFVQGNDRFGAAVGFVVRLQQAAPPGGIAITHSVRWQLVKNLAAQFDRTEWVEFKSIDEPIEIWLWKRPGDPRAGAETSASGIGRCPRRRRLPPQRSRASGGARGCLPSRLPRLSPRMRRRFRRPTSRRSPCSPSTTCRATRRSNSSPTASSRRSRRRCRGSATSRSSRGTPPMPTRAGRSTCARCRAPARRPLRARREPAQGRRPRPHHRPADRRHDRRASLGRPLRRRRREPLRFRGPDRRAGRRRAAPVDPRRPRSRSPAASGRKISPPTT